MYPCTEMLGRKNPCTEMLDERKEQRRFARGCLLISMTFYKFSKTWNQFP